MGIVVWEVKARLQQPPHDGRRYFFCLDGRPASHGGIELTTEWRTIPRRIVGVNQEMNNDPLRLDRYWMNLHEAQGVALRLLGQTEHNFDRTECCITQVRFDVQYKQTFDTAEAVTVTKETKVVLEEPKEDIHDY